MKRGGGDHVWQLNVIAVAVGARSASTVRVADYATGVLRVVGEEPPNPTPMIRDARPADINVLVDIENACFAGDRLSRRAFRYLLSKANAATLVDEEASGAVAGYAMVLFTRSTSLARLYSIAVRPECRGRGVGNTLLAAAERAALVRDAAFMRLEVRADDIATQAFYRRSGYRRLGVQTHYYEDATDAIRMEKPLARPPEATLIRVPYYAQTLDFTCGPAALLMAMHALDPAVETTQTAELRTWRESTTIFMTAGHGGCSPEGLALAAWRRGFDVELYLSDKGVLFVDSVRSETKKRVIGLVQEDFRAQLEDTSVAVVFAPLALDAMRRKFEAGGVPVVLVSAYRFDRMKQPHWVVVTGFDQKYVYVHDPDVDPEEDETPTDCMQVPIPLGDFDRMARYGRSKLKAALIISKRRHP